MVVVSAKMTTAATTMAGPDGKSHASDPARPLTTAATPHAPANTAMASGVVANRRAAAAGNRVGYLDESLMKHRHGLRHVENVDVVAGAVDKRRHLGVPAVSLMAEVHASFQELTHVE